MTENLRISKGMTVAQSRQVDWIAVKSFGMSSLVLMENAGRGAADIISRWASARSSITILCGTGNNGGDGLVIARHLYASGFNVSVWTLDDIRKLSQDARANYAILKETKLRIFELSETNLSLLPELQRQIDDGDMIIDAMLGTGAKGAPRGLMKSAVEWSNNSQSKRFAIDIPTGLDAQSGTCYAPTFRAEHTLTFVAEKVGFETQEARDHLGEVHVLPIGVPPEVIELALTTA